MTLKVDANFKGKLRRGLKNNIRNLVNFQASSWKSENLHFDQILLSKAWKILVKKHRRVMFPGTEKWCKVKGKTDYLFQKWHDEFGEFSPNHSKVQKFHFDGLFLPKLDEV